MYNRVLEHIESLGITIEDLAEQMNMGQDYLQKRLEGKRPFTLDEAWKLRNLLGMTESIESLFSFFSDKM
ncbi:MAG: helix-turn-helix domain-containing protein [Blautia sp.]|jgi:transcriptional regulator with XRE-family HTH domain